MNLPVWSSMFKFIHFDLSFNFRSWCAYLALERQHCFLLYVIKQRSIHFILYWECVLFYTSILFNDLSRFLLYTQTPLENLEPILREDIQKVFISFNFLVFHLFGFLFHSSSFLNMIWIPQIWDAVPKPQAHVHTPLSEFFNVRRSIYFSFFTCLFNCLCICYGIWLMTLNLKVEVTALSSYEDKEDKFKEEVPFHEILLCFKEFVKLFYLILEGFLIPIASKYVYPDLQFFGYKYACP